MGAVGDRASSLLGASARLNPSRARLADFIDDASNSVAPGSTVLDAGAGNRRYAKHFSQHVYESADFAKVDNVSADIHDYVCDLGSIPVEDNRYDLVLLTQVLEHLPEPRTVLLELHRVLKPGGALWLSAPLFFPEHSQPYDFYRYTQFAHRHMLSQAGFEVGDLKWMEGYFATLSYQLQVGALRLPFRPSHYGGGVAGVGGWLLMQAVRPLLFALSGVLALLDRRHLYTKSGHPKNYCVVAYSR